MFSDLIFEAIIVDINRATGHCTLNPTTANENDTVPSVKLPHFAGAGNAGLFVGLSIGTRVVAAYTSGRSRESAVILNTLPKAELYPDSFSVNNGKGVRVGTQPYPDIKEHSTVLRGNRGAEIALHDNGDISQTIAGGGGTFLRNNGMRTSYTTVSEAISEYSQAGRSISGAANRISPTVRAQSQKEGLAEIPLFADTFFAQLAEPKGFFHGSPARLQTLGTSLRNPEMSEHRHVINEFSTDSMFTGFVDEVSRLQGNLSLFTYSDAFQRNREPANSLHMAEHELVEIIGGNLIDIHGKVLDINYRELNYGGPENKVPTKQVEQSFDRARRISRRGVGYHFQLATNSRKTDPSAYETNFAFDVDKEGVFKLTVPRSTNTGNIPFTSSADYTAPGDNVNVSLAQESSSERIPVMLRDKNGVPLIPAGLEESEEGRGTGVRFSNSRKSPYFPAQSDTGVATSLRVNTTRYHNMYAACERLFGTTVQKVYIPEEFTNNYGIGQGNATGQPFEVLVPLEDQEGETNDSPIAAILDIAEYLSDPKKLIEVIIEGSNYDGYPKFMSTVGVGPEQPAIYPGGDTVVAGNIFEDDTLNPPFSNLFELELDGDNFETEIVDEGGNPAVDAGGRSANLNFMGLVEMSIGADNFDKKSLVLDTEGSVVSWIGKDKNNRSIITQTDGGVFVNIGGTYSGQDTTAPQMNPGRFSMRVNLTDKGFVDSQYDSSAVEDDENKNPMGNSDVMIDISEAGIVIAGMNPGIPMVIRNSGQILIESSASLTLKGNRVEAVGPDGKAINLLTTKNG